jgi:phage tail-like protein
MATGDRHDPYLSYNFSVEIDGVIVCGFSEVSGLQAEIEIQEYREGGVNEYIHKRAGPARYPSNLVLKRGIGDSTELWSWYCDVLQGTIQRKSLDVVLMDSTGTEQRRWTLQNAYPVKWTGPDFKAQSSEVAIESLELAHEGLVFAGGTMISVQVSLGVGFSASVTVEPPEIDLSASVSASASLTI